MIPKKDESTGTTVSPNHAYPPATSCHESVVCVGASGGTGGGDGAGNVIVVDVGVSTFSTVTPRFDPIDSFEDVVRVVMA